MLHCRMVSRRKSAERFSPCGIRHSLSQYATGILLPRAPSAGERRARSSSSNLAETTKRPPKAVSLWSGLRDSNPRSLGPKPSAIPNFAKPGRRFHYTRGSGKMQGEQLRGIEQAPKGKAFSCCRERRIGYCRYAAGGTMRASCPTR